MGKETRVVRGTDWIDRAAAAALTLFGVGAVIVAVRLGAAAAPGGDGLLTELRTRTERRVSAERDQIRPVLAAAARGARDVARSEAQMVSGRLAGNSQLHLFLAGAYRKEGAAIPALREYRRAVELLRDYTDRRSPQFIGADLAPWLRQVRPGLDRGALGDLHYLQRALAGGCS